MSSQAKVDSLQSSNLSHFVSSGVASAAEKISQKTLKRSLYVTLAGILFGAGTQLLFVWTAVQLFLLVFQS